MMMMVMMMILLLNFAAHLWTGNVQQRGYYHVFISLKQGVPCSANESKLSPKTLFSLMPERKGNHFFYDDDDDDDTITKLCSTVDW